LAFGKKRTEKMISLKKMKMMTLTWFSSRRRQVSQKWKRYKKKTKLEIYF